MRDTKFSVNVVFLSSREETNSCVDIISTREFGVLSCLIRRWSLIDRLIVWLVDRKWMNTGWLKNENVCCSLFCCRTRQRGAFVEVNKPMSAKQRAVTKAKVMLARSVSYSFQYNWMDNICSQEKHHITWTCALRKIVSTNFWHVCISKILKEKCAIYWNAEQQNSNQTSICKSGAQRCTWSQVWSNKQLRWNSVRVHHK